MEIYFRLQKGYFLVHEPNVEKKTKLQLGDKTKQDLQNQEMGKGLEIAMIGEGSDLKAKVGDRVLVIPNPNGGILTLPTSEGPKKFWLLNDSEIVGIFTEVPITEEDIKDTFSEHTGPRY